MIARRIERRDEHTLNFYCRYSLGTGLVGTKRENMLGHDHCKARQLPEIAKTGRQELFVRWRW